MKLIPVMTPSRRLVVQNRATTTERKLDTCTNNRKPTQVYRTGENPHRALTLGNGGAGPTGLFAELHKRYPKRDSVAVYYKQNITRYNLENIRSGEIDISLTYEPHSEAALVQAKEAQRHQRAFNDHFVLVGPKNNPAGIGENDDAPTAFGHIAQSGAYLSRDDNSGTNKKERQVWQRLGMQPWQGASWYKTYTTAPRESLLKADKEQLYTLTDRGTYLSVKPSLQNTRVYVQGGEMLLNPCSVLVKNRAPEHVHEFVDYLLSPAGQKHIAEFRVAGQRAFTAAHQQDFPTTEALQ